MKHVLMSLVILLASSFAYAGPKKESKTKVVLNKDNTVTLNNEFNSDTVAKLVQKTRQLDSRLPQKDPIYLVLSSPGGEIDAGLELIDNLKNLNRTVTTITLFSASMGFQTVQGLGDRLITEFGTLMSHKARGGFRGEFPGQIDSRYSYWLERVSEMNVKTVERTKGKHTLKSYENLIENEYWCQGAKCVAQGFADAVVDARCDESLQGTQEETEKFMFFGKSIQFTMVFDKCPLNTGILEEKIFVDGVNLFPEPETKKDTKVAKEPDYFSYNYGSTYSSRPSLTKEETEALNNRINQIKSDRTSKVVKKSY